jgi:hypothetical protein
MREKEKKVFFCLARGYSFLKKYKYIKLILRNIFLNKYLRNNKNTESVIFHEGNITSIDQVFIKLLSLNIQIKFINIKNIFIIPENFNWTGKSIYGLGYSLMCRFNYFQIWDFLKYYDTAIRVDDDVLLLNLRELESKDIYICSNLYSETHDQTNITFYKYLKENDSTMFYDHKFPPNCFYITRTKFWLSESVFAFLNDVSSAKDSLENRWGDTVVMGVALKKFGGTDSITIDKKISYVHLSHNLVVENGADSSISKNRFLRYFLIAKYFFNR